jgi:hypothetical protein
MAITPFDCPVISSAATLAIMATTTTATPLTILAITIPSTTTTVRPVGLAARLRVAARLLPPALGGSPSQPL